MILIMSMLDDAHANAVRWALVDNGIRCEIFDIFDMVNGGSASLKERSCELSWYCPRTNGLVSVNLNEVDCVWMRRNLRDHFNLSRIHPDDLDAVKLELAAFSDSVHGLASLLSKVSVNSLESRFSGSLKTIQLHMANRAGLITPDTLISNSPGEVREFLERNPRAIYKPYNQNVWEDGSSSFVQHAAVIDKTILDRPEEISLCPGIYQSCVEKAFELRVVVMGKTIHCARIDSQSLESTKVDWRNDYLKRVGISKYDEMPSSVSGQILEFMRLMGLTFGSIDMAVTPQGDYVFFEVNEQGQFLWLEDRNPDIRMLQHFCEYLSELAGHKVSIDVGLDDYMKSQECKDHHNFVQARSKGSAPQAETNA